MKKLVTSLFLIISAFSQAQTLVNRDWVTTSGTPNAIYDFQASHVDYLHNIIVVGNTFHAGQNENFLISKYDFKGNLVFRKEYDGPASKTDFATDVTTIGNAIYVTGVEGDTSTGASYITTIKLDSIGNIIWTSKYQNSYKKYNLGFRIVPDATGAYLFVCGTSQTGTTDFALTLLKYSVSGTQVWATSYDSVGLYDAGVDINVRTSDVLVYGVSGLSSASGDLITRSYDQGAGTLLGQSRINNAGAYVTRPVAIAKDNAQNIYLTGISADAGRMDDIVIIKLDSMLNLKWRKYIDGGNSKNDGVSGIKIDSRNNIIMTGWAANADTSKAIWTIKMKDSVIVWNVKRLCTISGKDAKANDVDLDVSNNIYVTGKVYNGATNSHIVIAYDSSGNTKWEKLYSYNSTSSDEGRNIKVDSGGSIFVYGRSLVSGSYTYTTMKFDQLTLPTSLVNDTSVNTQYIDAEIMVRFNPSILNQKFINNLDVHFGKIDTMMADSIIVKLSNKCGTNLHGSMLSKIVKGMTVKDSISISRGGDTVRIPKFWASLLLSNIPSSTRSVRSIKDSLDGVQPYVYYAAYNYVGTYDLCDASDPNFSSMTALFDASHADDINWCPAFSGGVVGSDSVKIGIYDSGINSAHEDLQFGGSTKILGGKDYTVSTPVPILNTSNSDIYGHGTAMTGIIGAQTGNGKGVAGVAGGNASSYGCALYCNRIGTIGGPSISTASLYNALVSDASSTGLALNVMNHSYHYGVGDNFLHDAFRYTARNGVVSSCSTGDDGLSAKYYPSGFNNLGFTIRVGASDSTGDWAGAFTNTAQGSTWGYGVDLIAPGLNYQYKILSYSSNTSYTYYIYGGAIADGTSISAAFVSGAAGLVLSKGSALSMPSGTTVKLAPEDVKNILTNKVTNLSSDPNYDPSKAGAGRLNVGHALDSVGFPRFKVRHYSVIPPFDAGTIVDSNKLIHLTWDYETDPTDTSTRLVKSGTYTADRYTFQANVSYSLGASEAIITGWPLPNQSDYWGNTHVSLLTSYDLDPDPLPSGSINTGTHQIQMTGYVYHIRKDHSGNPLDIWVPFRADSAQYYNRKMSYSIWTVDNSVTGIEQEKSNVLLAKIYPSPTSSLLNIEYYIPEPSEVQIRILDISGRVVMQDSYKEDAGIQTHLINASSLSNGMYLCEVSGRDGRFIAKFVKE